MPWSHSLNESLDIVEIVYEGEVTASELQESATAGIELEKREGRCRFLLDVSQMILAPSASMADIYHIPAVQYEQEGADREAPVAVYAPADSKAFETAQFYENASVNRNWKVKLFLDRDAAIEWLVNQPQ